MFEHPFRHAEHDPLGLSLVKMKAVPKQAAVVLVKDRKSLGSSVTTDRLTDFNNEATGHAVGQLRRTTCRCFDSTELVKQSMANKNARLT